MGIIGEIEGEQAAEVVVYAFHTFHVMAPFGRRFSACLAASTLYQVTDLKGRARFDLMLTRYLTDAIKDHEVSGAFVLALENWGKWSRYFGCMGYGHHGGCVDDYVIDDESALIIDKAFCELKETRPNMYLVLKFFYIGGLTEKQIMYKIQRLRLVEDRSLKYANTFTIREIINNGEREILNALIRAGNDAKCTS